MYTFLFFSLLGEIRFPELHNEVGYRKTFPRGSAVHCTAIGWLTFCEIPVPFPSPTLVWTFSFVHSLLSVCSSLNSLAAGTPREGPCPRRQPLQGSSENQVTGVPHMPSPSHHCGCLNSLPAGRQAPVSASPPSSALWGIHWIPLGSSGVCWSSVTQKILCFSSFPPYTGL